MSTQPNLSLNQFNQQPVQGQLALGIGSPPVVISAVISATGSPTLAPGQAVQFDSAITSTPSGLPPIVAASQTQYADGYILYNVKLGSGLTSATYVEVLLSGFIWLLANSTVTVGQVVEDGAVAGNVEALGTTGSSYPRGTSIDYGTAGQLIRVYANPAVTKVVAAAA